MDDATRDVVEEHVFAETEHEVGGILVGSLSSGVATITAAIPALRAAEGAMNVTFTHDVWSDVLDVVERDCPGLRIVGWYHSHPGFGLFLSEYDSFIQANFFAEPGMLALVVDPLAGELGWFTWADGEVRELVTGVTSRPAVPRQAVVAAATTRRRNATARTVGGGIVLAGLASVAGYAYGSLSVPAVTVAGDEPSTSGPATPSDSRVAELQSELAEATDRLAVLESAQTTTILYTVKPGESWWSIAGSLAGDGNQYRSLREANPELADLDPGDVIVIPGVPLAPND